MRNGASVSQLGQTKLEFQRLRYGNNRILKYHREKQQSTETVSSKDYQAMQEKIQSKVEQIRQFEHQDILLEEQIDEYEESANLEPSLRGNGKRYSTSTCMMVYSIILYLTIAALLRSTRFVHF